jgi:hypothetical protein
MDTKTRNLVLLGVLSLFCAGFLWSTGHVVLGRSFSCSVQSELSAWPRGTGADMLILKRASASRPSGQWGDDDFDVFSDDVVVGRIMKVHAAPVGSPWMWTLMVGYEDRTPTHGYAATREAAMAAFAKSWRRS